MNIIINHILFYGRSTSTFLELYSTRSPQSTCTGENPDVHGSTYGVVNVKTLMYEVGLTAGLGIDQVPGPPRESPVFRTLSSSSIFSALFIIIPSCKVAYRNGKA